MAKIIISVTNDLLTDQRVHKVCASLQEVGYDLLLIGRRFHDSKPLERSYPTRRMRLIFNSSFLFYVEYNFRLFFYLLFSKADLFLSNDTDSLLANYLAATIRNKPLVFDAHEMFPEVPELTNRPFVKSVWTAIENCIFPKLKYAYTVCQSIADIYNKKYNINMQVVRNIPLACPAEGSEIICKIKNAQAINKKEGEYVLLYQGAINVGRGIEWMIEAMPFLDNFVFYIAGTGDKMQEMQALVREKKLQHRVIFLGRIPLEQLSEYTACADIGISFLENKGLNYYYSLPNRIFDFMRAQVPVIASDFPEISAVIKKYELGILIDHYEPQYIASVIKEMIKIPFDEQKYSIANSELSWENESKTILQMVEKALTLN
ncbi:hypothetical protein AwDysgo_19530 [Bacteroidales bacterium]|nr:hypothetical protein AwDysgo_19530 [Bacteroidales bacterium]